jgi:hypothetical protein
LDTVHDWLSGAVPGVSTGSLDSVNDGLSGVVPSVSTGNLDTADDGLSGDLPGVSTGSLDTVDDGLSGAMPGVCTGGLDTYDVVGPVCETGDFLGKGRKLAIAEGDLLAVCSAGAYGFVMASNYNSRCRPADVMVHGYSYTVVRSRETMQNLVRAEQVVQH